LGRDQDGRDQDEVAASYDRLAGAYAERIYDELDGKPFDRALLDRFAEQVRGHGFVLDLGCGPGHVARYLQQRDVKVVGVDLSPGMIETARGRAPRVDFRVGDMRSLDLGDASAAGAVAFYSLIHFSPLELDRAVGEIARVLQPGAPLLVAVHRGSQTVHLDELWGIGIRLDFVFFEPEVLGGALGAAGLEVVEALTRPPYRGVEVETERIYLWARRAEPPHGQ
jgi:ubiquinone/menaquinone biosynthesis C-methylase UbiE